MGIISEDVDRIIMLMDEINVAEKKLQPHDTGHIHTAISYLKSRITELQQEIALSEAK